ncbi:hypothetical protein [Parapedobacter tibetensis]|uniref:hypothetical protein n=1 Tax=Parapedobacter tibetensis TaxID=2972951 RepID=UPI00214DDF7F|nr:hypothetical protein [Parapedobacter tibetensis]
MKNTLLIIMALGMLSIHTLSAQTTVNVATGGTGWKRIATVQGQNGRGFGRVSVYTRGGGNFTPCFLHIDWFKDWSNIGGISVHSDSKSSPHWSAARLTGDGTNTFIEVNFTKDIPSSSLSVKTDDGYGWRPATLYTGTLLDGDGTVRASATVARMNIENQFMVNYNGNVGIGTTTPADKLSVNGRIRAREVKVETANWPDYVFRGDYELQPLPELEAYIKSNGHLPGMPTAKEAEADGIDLGEMNRKLLEKVEQLTLHLIEKDREMEAIRKEVDRMKAMESRLQHLEANILQDGN